MLNYPRGATGPLIDIATTSVYVKLIMTERGHVNFTVEKVVTFGLVRSYLNQEPYRKSQYFRANK